MIIQKYNEKERKYVDHKIPDNWKIPIFVDNMNEKINCVNCGKEIEYGNSYTSHRYHTSTGFGFMECADCYHDYMPIYMKYKGEIND